MPTVCGGQVVKVIIEDVVGSGEKNQDVQGWVVLFLFFASLSLPRLLRESWWLQASTPPTPMDPGWSVPDCGCSLTAVQLVVDVVLLDGTHRHVGVPQGPYSRVMGGSHSHPMGWSR